jgi:hypothetical protein
MSLGKPLYPSTLSARRSKFYEAVDIKFHEFYRQQNGGVLPPELTDKNESPRRLTNEPRDNVFLKKWVSIAHQERRSMSTNKKVASPVVSCPLISPSATAQTAKDSGSATQSGKTGDKLSSVPCRLAQISVTAEDRKYTSEMKPPPSNAKGNDVLEIVAGSSSRPKRVTVKSRISAGPCPEGHKGYVLDTSAPMNIVKKRSDSELEFEAVSESLEYQFRVDPFSLIWPARCSVEEYKIRGSCCNGSVEGVVRAYTDLAWDISIPLRLGSEREASHSEYATHTKLKLADSQSADFKLKASFDGNTHEVSYSFVHKVEETLFALRTACEISEFIAEGLSQFTDELTITFPTVILSGKCGWEEVEGKWNCGFAYDLGFKADPLFGLKISFDVTEQALRLLDAFAGIGEVLIRIKRAIAKGRSGKHWSAKARLGFYLTGNGQIEGFLGFKKTAEEEKGKPRGSIEAKDVYIDFAGKAEGEFKVDCYIVDVKVGAAAVIGARAEFSGKIEAVAEGDGLYGLADLYFHGLYIYYITYIEGEFALTSTDEDKQLERQGRVKDLTTTSDEDKGGYQYAKGDKEPTKIGQPLIRERKWESEKICIIR